MTSDNQKITCTNCGTEFECGANTHDCWCNAVPNIMPVQGNSCWCPKCLQQQITQQQERLNKPKE